MFFKQNARSFALVAATASRIQLHCRAAMILCVFRDGNRQGSGATSPESAEVAELADALGSGSSEGNLMGVQIPPSAPYTGLSLPTFQLQNPRSGVASIKSVHSLPLQSFRVSLAER